MRRLANMTGGLLGLLVLGALVVGLALTFGGLPRGAKPASQAFQSPIETPTQPPYPPPAPPTPPQPATPTAVPTPPGLRTENIRIEKEVQLTFEEGNFFSSWISWSPNGDKVLVNRYNGQTIQGENVTFLLTDIWEIPLDGGTPRQVVSNAYGGIWSPNGRKLLYFSLTAPDRQDIYVSDEDGANAIKIASGSPTPAWWLNDANIVYVDQGRLWVANVAQRRSQILNEYLDLTPARPNRWNKPYALSPENGKLAYIDGFRLFVMGISEAPGHPVADNLSPGSSSRPNLAWSPRGRHLAYVAYVTDEEGYKPGLWLVDAEGTNPRLLSMGQTTDWFERPFWFPSGTILGFSQFSGGTDKHFKIYLVNTDGTGLTDLTGSRESQQFPVLAPDGNKIAFWREGNLWVAFLALK